MDAHGLDTGEQDDIAKQLSRVNGAEFYSLLLWKLPEGKGLYETSPERDANEYIQCAGSAERMTVEVRRMSGGNVEHFVVGRASGGHSSGNNETIHWDSVDTMVAANEVFSADEAAELFLSYYRTGWVPSSYTLRPLSLGLPEGHEGI